MESLPLHLANVSQIRLFALSLRILPQIFTWLIPSVYQRISKATFPEQPMENNCPFMLDLLTYFYSPF
jgi:hypothetical protein